MGKYPSVQEIPAQGRMTIPFSTILHLDGGWALPFPASLNPALTTMACGLLYFDTMAIRMFPLKYILLIFVCSTLTAHAQQHWLQGYLRDSITHFPISNGRVINEQNGQRVQTNASGYFRLPVAPNDLLVVLAPAYLHDTLRYTPLFSDTVVVYLSPSGALLPGVTVRSQYTKYQLDSMERKGEFEENRGQRLPAVSSSNTSGFGVGLNLDRLFKKKYKFQKRNEERFARREKDAYVEYRFSPHVVAYYTGLKGEELRLFLYRYRPSYEWLRQHPSEEELLLYINEKLKAFKAEKRSRK